MTAFSGVATWLRINRWHWLAVVICVWPLAPLNGSAQVGTPSRPEIFDEPMNFSAAPELPEIAPVDRALVLAAMSRGVDFLLEKQNKDGSWGSATRAKDLNIYAPVPGAHDAFRMGTTSLAISALIEIRRDISQDLSEDRAERIDRAIERSERWLMERLPNLRRATGDAIYNVWGHGYGLKALVRMHERRSENDPSREEIAQLIAKQFESLQRYESVDGGWGYYDFRYHSARPTSDSTSFTTASILVGLYEAKQIGVVPPQRLVDRAVDSIKRQQKPDYSYLYAEDQKFRPMNGINRPGGSLGRTQSCNLSLRLWGDEAINDNVVKHWLWRLYLRNGWLDIGRKRPVPHESWFQVAGYFYYYGHYYAAMSMELLPVGERAPYQAMLAELMLDRQEANGAWWDYPLYDYHEAYGTSYALMTLLRCLPNSSHHD